MQESSFGRLIGVLVSPAKTFEAIAARPTWVVALLVLVVIGVVTGSLISGKIDYEDVIRQSLEQQGRQLGEAETQQAIDIGEKIARVMTIVGPLVFQPLVYLLLAVIFMVLFKVLGGDLSYVKSLAVIVHGMMPRLVLALLSIPVILGRQEFSAKELESGGVMASNPGAFLGEDAGPGLVAFLSSLDVFSIWAVALLIVGFAAAAKISKGTAASGVVGLWIIYILGKVGFAALRG
jgi:hypothetical protein